MNASTPPRPLLTPWLHSGLSHKAQDPLPSPPHYRPVWGLGERENITCLLATMPRMPAVSLLVETMSCWGRDCATSPSLHCITVQSPGRQPEPSDNTGLVLALGPGKNSATAQHLVNLLITPHSRHSTGSTCHSTGACRWGGLRSFFTAKAGHERLAQPPAPPQSPQAHVGLWHQAGAGIITTKGPRCGRKLIARGREDQPNVFTFFFF